MKVSEKSHFLYREGLRVDSDLMTREHPQDQDHGWGYANSNEGRVELGSRKLYLLAIMIWPLARQNSQFDQVYVDEENILIDLF